MLLWAREEGVRSSRIHLLKENFFEEILIIAMALFINLIEL